MLKRLQHGNMGSELVFLILNLGLMKISPASGSGATQVDLVILGSQFWVWIIWPNVPCPAEAGEAG
jgi:hypothetical protein